MVKDRLSLAKKEIEEFFYTNESKIYNYFELRNIFSNNKSKWNLAKSTTLRKFVDFLLEELELKKITLDFPSDTIVRYIWGKEDLGSILELCSYLKSNSYLSHYTAMFLHGFTKQELKNIYVNAEQSPKRADGKLTQESIDKAFRRPARKTRNITFYQKYKITLLNGKYTGNTGVTYLQYSGHMLRLTDVERTLIDIAVRPIYSGGVNQVLKAYILAKDSVCISKVKDYLEDINFVYPYRQVIGFYLEKAGYPENKLRLFESGQFVYDFYLTHQIENISYSKRWKLYYPKDLI